MTLCLACAKTGQSLQSVSDEPDLDASHEIAFYDHFPARE